MDGIIAVIVLLHWNAIIGMLLLLECYYYYTGMRTRRSLDKISSGWQYSMRLDRLLRAHQSLHPFNSTSVPEQLNITADTRVCKMIDGCSLKLHIQ